MGAAGKSTMLTTYKPPNPKPTMSGVIDTLTSLSDHLQLAIASFEKVEKYSKIIAKIADEPVVKKAIAWSGKCSQYLPVLSKVVTVWSAIKMVPELVHDYNRCGDVTEFLRLMTRRASMSDALPTMICGLLPVVAFGFTGATFVIPIFITGAFALTRWFMK